MRGLSSPSGSAQPGRLSSKPCLGCGWCCLNSQCQESHILHGYLARCPELYFDSVLALYRCALSSKPEYRHLLRMGLGCCAPLNPWRDNPARERD